MSDQSKEPVDGVAGALNQDIENKQKFLHTSKPHWIVMLYEVYNAWLLVNMVSPKTRSHPQFHQK